MTESYRPGKDCAYYRNSAHLLVILHLDLNYPGNIIFRHIHKLGHGND
jgi:hypothetical protein